jgi:NAD(P)-dependent dehydrogenase (short-subunit alcohol dehydrogenase family)
MLLAGKVAIVTGGAGINGLGFASARLMVQHGARIVILDLASAHPEEAAASLGAATPEAPHLGIAVDVCDREACLAAAETIAQRCKRADVLLNNAGITQPRKFLDITPQDYDAVSDVSLRGMLYMSQAMIPLMRRSGGGSIINTSSISAQRGGGILGGPHYAAAKAGMLGLARAMAREFGPEGIRVNCITPGLIETDIMRGRIPEEQLQLITTQVPLGRLGRPSDIAGCVLFLASELSAYCTGITLDANGGMLIH